jgi:hypothetical protein
MNKSTPVSPAVLALCLVLLMALVTGCPHNDYEVELTPRGNTLERQLTFYRADGVDSNGVPVYQKFPEDQLAAITKLYPPGQLKADGKRYIARAEFTKALPPDIGGAGSWTNFTSSLGNAAIYVERFRGNDDLATTSGERMEAADQLTDLLLGWSRMELGGESNYENLRRFLDEDFRRDLKNLTLYSWLQAVISPYHSKASEEFIFRFGQYLNERGYFTISQLPELFAVAASNDDRAMMRLVQRLIAKKMGALESDPTPQSLAFLAAKDAREASWEKFLVTSDFYHTRIKRWEAEVKLKPDLAKPSPAGVMGELFITLMDFRLGGADDHLVVKLNLSAAPIRTNGKWNESRHQVVWESELDEKEQTPRLPAFCYASWSTANESFQAEHFGKVILAGEELLQYGLWRAGRDAKHAGEWEAFLAGLKPDSTIIAALDAFRFSDEPAATTAKPDEKTDLASELPRALLKAALTKPPPNVTR